MVLQNIRRKNSEGMIGHGLRQNTSGKLYMIGHGLDDKNRCRRLGGMIGHGPAMTGHAFRQKHTGKNDMIGHGPAMTGHAFWPKSTLFFQLLELIFNDFLFSKASLIN